MTWNEWLEEYGAKTTKHGQFANRALPQDMFFDSAGRIMIFQFDLIDFPEHIDLERDYGSWREGKTEIQDLQERRLSRSADKQTGLLVGGGAICVLSDGFEAIRPLTNYCPPSIKVNGGGFEILWS